MKNKSPIKKLVYSILTLIFFITFFTHAGENTLSLLLDPVNYIPKDSNIFTFNATVIADGVVTAKGEAIMVQLPESQE